jgi:predicted secreted Zn-dependent protease
VTREIVETLALVGLRVHKDPRVIKVTKVNAVTLAQKATPEIKDHREFKVLEV